MKGVTLHLVYRLLFYSLALFCTYYRVLFREGIWDCYYTSFVKVSLFTYIGAPVDSFTTLSLRTLFSYKGSMKGYPSSCM